MNAQRSGCPINLTVEAPGDRWSLIVIRDLMFGLKHKVSAADTLCFKFGADTLCL